MGFWQNEPNLVLRTVRRRFARTNPIDLDLRSDGWQRHSLFASTGTLVSHELSNHAMKEKRGGRRMQGWPRTAFCQNEADPLLAYGEPAIF
jgi:hypothetical protein